MNDKKENFHHLFIGDSKNLAVGQPLVPGKTQLPEGVYYHYGLEGHTLTICLDQPTQGETQSISLGKYKFALFEFTGMIFVLIQFEGMTWMDAPYHISINSPDPQNIPSQIEPGEAQLFTILLVDASSGVVEGIRFVSPSSEFTHALHEAIIRQVETPITQEKYDQVINFVYSRLTTQDMVAESLIQR
ncbi:MAG: hypothetical protein AAGG02_12105 [Cyanobacteria bacterium P01_H01_bin.15]